MPQKHHICVCICTYKRPQHLNNLLQKLKEQETRGFFDYSIVVVDNDMFESARLTVESHACQLTIAISYHVEARQNISLARNKAIENSKGDFVGFIDDDELPDPRWLLNLYTAINRYNSAGVLGPVLPYFEKKPPKWILRGGFFNRPVCNSGHILQWKNTRTGNALLKKAIFRETREWFNPIFGSGGEDRDFFRRKITQGYVFVWCAEAPVFELVPPIRWRKKVLLKRALLRGKMAYNSIENRPLNILISTAATGLYTLSLPVLFIFSSVFGYELFFKYLVKICDHLGKILALFGIEIVREKYII